MSALADCVRVSDAVYMGGASIGKRWSLREHSHACDDSCLCGQAMGKNLCSMCGFEAPYTCRITGMRLCRCVACRMSVSCARSLSRLEGGGGVAGREVNLLKVDLSDEGPKCGMQGAWLQCSMYVTL